MKPGQLCTFRVDRTGQQFGELTVIGDVGNHVYRTYSRILVVPILQLICPKGHIEQRNITSLRVTKDKTHCKRCWHMKRWGIERLQITDYRLQNGE